MSMFTLYYPKVVFILFGFLNVVNLENEYFSALFLYTVNQSQIVNKNSWDYRFQNQQIGSTSILENWADTFFILLCLIIIYLSIYLIGIVISNPPKTVRFIL